MNRRWHLVPIVIASAIFAWLYQLHHAEFFGQMKDAFSTVGAFLGGLGLAATLLEVLRAGSTLSAITSDRDMTAARVRVGEIRRVVDEVRGVHRLLDAGSKVGRHTLSEIIGLLSALLDSDLKIEGTALSDLDRDVMGLAGKPSKVLLDKGVGALVAIRRCLEKEQKSSQKILDQYIGVKI